VLGPPFVANPAWTCPGNNRYKSFTVARGILSHSFSRTCWWRKTFRSSKTPQSDSNILRSGDCAGHGRCSTLMFKSFCFKSCCVNYCIVMTHADRHTAGLGLAIISNSAYQFWFLSIPNFNSNEVKKQQQPRYHSHSF